MKKILPIIISVILLVTSKISVQASQNVLSQIDIDGAGKYCSISLVSNEPARLSKTVISKDSIILNLDNIKAANHVETTYSNHSNVENVVVDAIDNNSVSVMIQGDDIAYSAINFRKSDSIQQLKNSISDSFSTLGMSFIMQTRSGMSAIIVLFLLIGISIFEIRFIKSKYKELNMEKSLLEKDLERTSEFKEYSLGYGNQGLKKPYTTPIYTNPSNFATVRANYLKRLKNLKTEETTTLNSLLSEQNSEKEIINKIVDNNKMFNSSQNTMTVETTTTPISRPKPNLHIQRMEALTKLYEQTDKTRHILEKRLNELY